VVGVAAQLSEKASRPLDVREEEGHRAARKLRHALGLRLLHRPVKQSSRKRKSARDGITTYRPCDVRKASSTDAIRTVGQSQRPRRYFGPSFSTRCVWSVRGVAIPRMS